MSRKVDAARETARALLDKVGVKRVPTPLPKVARHLKVEVEYAPLDDELSGMAFVKDGRRFAWVNALHHPNRQRFSLAHELGHHVLHTNELSKGVHVDKGILRRDVMASKGTDLFEVQANAFASELLVPQAALDAELQGHLDLDDIDQVAELAERFRVSLSAMQFRLMRG